MQQRQTAVRQAQQSASPPVAGSHRRTDWRKLRFATRTNSPPSPLSRMAQVQKRCDQAQRCAAPSHDSSWQQPRLIQARLGRARRWAFTARAESLDRMGFPGSLARGPRKQDTRGRGCRRGGSETGRGRRWRRCWSDRPRSLPELAAAVSGRRPAASRPPAAWAQAARVGQASR